jgi:signal transduction histidine kinase
MPPTAEFAALCQAQVALLVQAFGADWCAVYLTRGIAESGEADLIPVVAYPGANSGGERGMSLSLLPSESAAASAPLTAAVGGEAIEYRNWQGNSAGQPMVFPLLEEKQGEVMGLLVAGRRDRPWNQRELGQIEKIVRTLAIARHLDRRQHLWQQQANRQGQLRLLERHRLDDLLHQLRNPLTALRTFSKLLLKRLLPEDPSRPAVQGILRESERLGELLVEFEADLAAMEADAAIVTLEATPTLLPAAPSTDGSFLPGSPLQLESVGMAEILEPLLLSQQAIAQERQIALTTEIPDHLPPVRANASALREILSNLIDNALKYTPAGGAVSVKLGLNRTAAGKSWQGIAIADTGYGIPAGDRQRIFERHYRGVQAAGEIDGTGLGLAIVKDLVERMPGEIAVESPNVLATDRKLPGTTFTVWLPLWETLPPL